MPGHNVREDFPWSIVVVDHPPREDSPQYRRSRRLLNRLAAELDNWVYGPGPYQDHHGGGVWVRNEAGWLCLQMPVGIEWSAQFCADPAKVDRIRLQVARIVKAFPLTLEGYEHFGYRDGFRLLGAPITDTAAVAEWTDSIFNASVPLHHEVHSGVLPNGVGYHHYPKPIIDISHFKFDDFDLFVTDSDGLAAAVVPVGMRGSGDGRVRLLAAHPESAYVSTLGRVGDQALIESRDQAILGPDDPLARAAFQHQEPAIDAARPIRRPPV
jgi:hypothetical protein